MAILGHAKFKIPVLRHGEHKLEAIPLENECLLLSLSICVALKSFGVSACRDLAYLPRMEGGHTCVTRWSLALGVAKSFARLSNVKALTYGACMRLC